MELLDGNEFSSTKFQSDLRRIQQKLRDIEEETSVDEEVYYLKEKNPSESILRSENEELKEEIKRLHIESDQIAKTRSTSRTCRQKLNEAQAQANLYERQTEELRKLLLAEQKANRYRHSENYFARIAALEDRVKELQHENFELRRELAGLTPERIGGQRFDQLAAVDRCENCFEIAKQKAQQAKYFETKLIQSRNMANDYRLECQKLNDKMKQLQSQFVASESRYKDLLEKQTDNVSIYKHRSDRLEKQNIAQLKGLESEIDSIKTKLTNIEKVLIKTQLTIVGEKAHLGLLNELKNLTSESKELSEQVKRLRDKKRT